MSATEMLEAATSLASSSPIAALLSALDNIPNDSYDIAATLAMAVGIATYKAAKSVPTYPAAAYL